MYASTAQKTPTHPRHFALLHRLGDARLGRVHERDQPDKAEPALRGELGLAALKVRLGERVRGPLAGVEEAEGDGCVCVGRGGDDEGVGVCGGGGDGV